MARLKRAFGRRIASLKNEAKQTLPDGSPEELAAQANELALAQGYTYDFTPEHFMKKRKGRRRRAAAAAAASPRPSKVDEAMVAFEAARQVGGLTKLRKIVDQLI